MGRIQTPCLAEERTNVCTIVIKSTHHCFQEIDWHSMCELISPEVLLRSGMLSWPHRQNFRLVVFQIDLSPKGSRPSCASVIGLAHVRSLQTNVHTATLDRLTNSFSASSFSIFPFFRPRVGMDSASSSVHLSYANQSTTTEKQTIFGQRSTCNLPFTMVSNLVRRADPRILCESGRASRAAPSGFQSMKILAMVLHCMALQSKLLTALCAV
jgi:hypothetical protein